MNTQYNRTRFACYYSYLSMSSVFVLPALLFVTFHEKYGVSYTLLGTLVLINFCTQLCIDLIFSFFSKYFNIRKTVTVMPLITAAGLFAYGILPTLMPGAVYLGLVIGTVLFSVSAGLSEVLMSPIIAAIPSEHPDRDMSLLHSLYAWGVVTMVVIITLFFKIFGTDNWMYLSVFLGILPIGASVMFALSPMPEMELGSSGKGSPIKAQWKGILLCFLCIFFGSASENVMTNWISSYMESGLSISKSLCDIIGMAVFAVLLGLVRVLYAKYGTNIILVLQIGMFGAAVCYLLAGFCNNIYVSIAACILTGAFTAMLWPGTLIMMEENMPALGVAAYALMAAGGDFGASVAPQLMGIVADNAGLKTGMAVAAVFPIVGFVLLFVIRRYFRKMIL